MQFLVASAKIDGGRGFFFDDEEELRCFRSSDLSAWIIVDIMHLSPVIKVDLGELWLLPYLYNGERVWAGSGGCVFKSVTDGWILTTSSPPAEPVAEKDLDGVTWIGDGWWQIGTPNPFYPELECTPRGTNLNETNGATPTPPAVRWWWPRWEWESAGSSVAPWGVYVAKDGADETGVARRIVGSQQYRDERRRVFTLAPDKLSLSCTDGRIVRYSDGDGLWLLGEKGVGSWFQSESGPDRTAGMTLVAWKHDEDTGEDVLDTETDPLVLTFYRVAATEGKDRIYMAEVARWH